MSHKDELVRVVNKLSGIYLIQLPKGCSSGDLEAAESFAEAFDELCKKALSCSFQFIPFAYYATGGVRALLAIKKID